MNKDSAAYKAITNYINDVEDSIDRIAESRECGIEMQIVAKFQGYNLKEWDDALDLLKRRSLCRVFKHYVYVRANVTITLILD